MRLLKVIVALAILAFAGLAGYAYLGDMTPRRTELRVPVTLEDGAATAGRATPTTPATPDAPSSAPVPPTAPQANAPEPSAPDAAPASDASGSGSTDADTLD